MKRNYSSRYNNRYNNSSQKSYSLSKKSKSKKNFRNNNELKSENNYLKCPICNQICLININKSKLTFSYKCNNDYFHQQNNIISENFSNTKFFKENSKLYLTESDLFCSDHPKFNFNYYCVDCKKNICQKCLKDHIQHGKIDLNSIKPKDNEVFIYKLRLRDKNENLNKIINEINIWKKEFEEGINDIIKTITNIYNLEEFIILNYDSRKNNQNYNYIQNFNHIKGLDIKIPELEKFIKNYNWEEKGHLLIEAIINIQNKFNETNEDSNKNINLKYFKNKEYKEKDNIMNLIQDNNYIEGNNNYKHNNKNNIFNKNKNINISILNNGNKYNNKNNHIKNNSFLYKSYPKRVEKQISLGNSLKKIKNNILTTDEKNIYLENKINNSIDNNNIESNLMKSAKYKYQKSLKPIVNLSNNSEIKEDNIDNNIDIDENIEINNINNKIYNIDNNSDTEIIKKELNYEYNNINNINEQNNIKDNINLNSNENNKCNDSESNNNDYVISTNKNILNDGIIDNKIIINNIITNKDLLKNTKIFNEKIKNDLKPTKLELKFELKDKDIIKSIEIINNKRILISNSKVLSIYKLNAENELDMEFYIKDFNNKINYVTQISNGNIVVCFINIIYIIKFIEENFIIKQYTIIQKLKSKNECININKVIEIKHKNYLISCDNNYITIYSKLDLKEYKDINYIKIDEEVKCIEYINVKSFVSVHPQSQKIIFYDNEDIKNNNVIDNIQSIFGRYVISKVIKYNCIFVAGIQGIYLISTELYNLMSFFKIDEWVSSLDFDSYNNHLICGSWKKNYVNKEKCYNLIIFSIEKENIENNSLNNVNIVEEERKSNIHQDKIGVIKCYKDGYILTGSNDKTFKLWK